MVAVKTAGKSIISVVATVIQTIEADHAAAMGPFNGLFGKPQKIRHSQMFA